MKYYDILQMFTGGGSRFGYYLGSYAALVHHQRAPNAIFGSCGGSLAAWLVSQAPEPARLYELATSSVLHQTLQQMCQSRTPKSPFIPWMKMANLYWQTRSSARLQRVHQRDTPESLLTELQEYAAFESLLSPHAWLQNVADFAAKLPNPQPHRVPDIIISASRLLSQNNRVVFQLILFANAVFRQPENPAAQWAMHRQMSDVAVFPLDNGQAAVAASVADMYYQAPIYLANVGHVLGGVMELTPVEMVSQWSDVLFAENKPAYSPYFVEPAILRVFGTPANVRLMQIRAFAQHHSSVHLLPFEHNRHALKGQYAAKSWDWFSGSLKVDVGDAARFAEQMDAQWRYGYEITKHYLEKDTSCKQNY